MGVIHLRGSGGPNPNIAANKILKLVVSPTEGNIALQDSIMSDDGATVTVVGNLVVTGSQAAGADAKADGATKGIAAFAASDFNDNGSGIVSLDFTNGQAADASHKGYLTAADWSTFNSKLTPSGSVGLINTALGFFSATPVAQPTYVASNVTTARSYDANNTTLDELADVVGTLIADLRLYGLVL